MFDKCRIVYQDLELCTKPLRISPTFFRVDCLKLRSAGFILQQ